MHHRSLFCTSFTYNLLSGVYQRSTYQKTSLLWCLPGAQKKMNETRVKSFYRKPLHVGMVVKKAQKQGTQKKTNLIQEEYPTSIPFHH